MNKMPIDADIQAAYEHAKWLRSAEPLDPLSRMLCDLGHEVQRLRAALELGQENCNAEYDRLKAEREEQRARAEKAEAELARIKPASISICDNRISELRRRAARRAGRERRCLVRAIPIHQFPTKAQMAYASRRDSDPCTICWLGDNEQNANGAVVVVKDRDAAKMVAYLLERAALYHPHIVGGGAPVRKGGAS
jgi:hypothetical protein